MALLGGRSGRREADGYWIPVEEWERMETEFSEKTGMERSGEYHGIIKNIFAKYNIRFASPIRRSRNGDPSGSSKSFPPEARSL